MVIKIPGKILESFYRRAARIFPKEFYCYLVGEVDGEDVVVREAIYPQAGEIIGDENFVLPSNYFFQRAKKEAAESGLYVVGDLHSHCYDVGELGLDSGYSDPSPSYADFTRLGKPPFKGFRFFGICEIVEKRNGRKSKKFTWWEAKPLPKIKIV